MAQSLAEIIERLVQEPNGVFGATRESDWNSGNSAATFMKTCGELRLIWNHTTIVVTDTKSSDENLAAGRYWGQIGMDAPISDYGHLPWWQKAQRDLHTQQREAQQKGALDALYALLPL
jgi:hypothetical protein